MKMNKPRLTIEVSQETKEDFIKKTYAEGFTLKGIILRWINNFLNKKNWKF